LSIIRHNTTVALSVREVLELLTRTSGFALNQYTHPMMHGIYDDLDSIHIW